MKILFAVPYIYVPDFPEHSKNRAGFGIMVNDIATAVSKAGNEVAVMAHAFGPRRQINGFSILENSPWSNILHGRHKGILRRNKTLKTAKVSFKTRLREFYYYLNIGCFEHRIKAEKPDIVHIHGCHSVLSEMMDICKKYNVPFVVTLHGLLQDDLGAHALYKQHERELIKHSYERNIPITVIASSMKDRCLSPYYGAKRNDNVTVITNGIDVSAKKAAVDIREKLGIDKDKKVILSVGSLCPLKNQFQTLRAFALLPPSQKDKAVLLFAGLERESYDVAKEAERLGLQDKVFILGFIPREELKNYYSAADITVTASVTEGFGIPIVEGFTYGVPNVTFADLDAIPDVYDEKAMLLCNERSDEAFAAAIGTALHTEWNKDAIAEHSKKFSLEAMAEKYNEVYKRIV